MSTVRTIEQVNREIAEKQEEITNKKRELDNFELDNDDYRNAYDDCLDEIYDFSSVGGPFEYMQPSRVLKESDPTAYRCGLCDYVDSQDRTEHDDYKALDSELDDLNDELYDLQTELEELEGDNAG